MKFEDVMTAAEAAERWKISPVTVKQACSGQRNTPPRFTSDECRKSKGTWLVSRQAMERLYGEEPKMLAKMDKYLIEVTDTLLENLKENFNISEWFHNDLFAKAWSEYKGVSFELDQRADAEYYASDFVWWVLTESREEYYNMIGLVDVDDKMYDWLKQPCRQTDEFEFQGKRVIAATVCAGENKGQLLELNEDYFYAQYILQPEDDNIYFIK
ncbi:MAG: helix-turn-helix domain-containing protein [Veillonella sp.]|uniref:helix-turn-helix domain-containing protein n=1 Tax=Veillonella sp. TaxID=1926307 RepID=UPI00290AFAEE|nr:helix-turn-helix domain-containing protein [Veillonella sp.]MDU3822818.1 helix-turn-helix domain-containing protein [Veillonella sp.]